MVLLAIACIARGQEFSAASGAKLIPIAPGWAGNTVNVAIFRKNSLTSRDQTQIASFYDQQGNVMLAKRLVGSSDWEVIKTPHAGNVRDAHNVISIAIDGGGFLHMAWDHHNHPLRYARASTSDLLGMSDKLTMTGQNEDRLSYPEFYNLPDGGLIFAYRDGSSGNGNLVLNRYDVRTLQWKQLHANLIDGQGSRNAYWQMAVDEKGVVHLSWVWRESPDVASNHDLCYARSPDGGKTWVKSTGQTYTLPITAETAEYAAKIPQQHELINQTSMTTDSRGRPYIATYWRDEGTDIPQYHVVWNDGSKWQTSSIGGQTVSFRLGGAGSKRLPLARPQIFVNATGTADKAYVLFRDEGRGNKVSVAICNDLAKPSWRIEDLTNESVQMWEPTYDQQLWRKDKVLNAFVQSAVQVDGEGVSRVPPSMTYVLEWKP